MNRFAVEIYRDGKWWMADIPALDLLTQSRRLAAIETATREAIAVTLDTSPDSFDVEMSIRPIGDIDVETIRTEINRAQQTVEALEREVSARSKELTRSLAEEGVPVRDIGTIIGLSHQRAHQLINEK